MTVTRNFSLPSEGTPLGAAVSNMCDLPDNAAVSIMYHRLDNVPPLHCVVHPIHV